MKAIRGLAQQRGRSTAEREKRREEKRRGGGGDRGTDTNTSETVEEALFQQTGLGLLFHKHGATGGGGRGRGTSVAPSTGNGIDGRLTGNRRQWGLSPCA